MGPCLGGAITALVVLVGTSCGVFDSRKRSGSEVPNIATKSAPATGAMSPFELQSRVTAFADEFAMGLRQPTTELKKELEQPLAGEVHRWVTTHATTAFILASGPNPIVNMLDLTGMATLARMTMEEYWVPEVFGEKGKALLEWHQRSEEEIWKVAADVLSEEQQEQLRKLIRDWREARPTERMASFVSICDYAKERWSSPILATETSRSLLRMVYLDPLSNLDPATRQLAQTRYTAERLIYFVQRSPAILRLHTEMLFNDVTQTPQVLQVLADVTGFRETSNHFVETLDQLPSRIVREQERFLEELSKKENVLTDLSREYRSAFQAGSEMATSVAQAISTLDAYTARVTTKNDEDETLSQPVTATAKVAVEDPSKRPYDVLDYATTAEEISHASKNLDAAIQSLDKLLASPAWSARQGEVSTLVAEVEESAARITHRLFVRGLILLALFLAGGLVVLTIYSRQRRENRASSSAGANGERKAG